MRCFGILARRPSHSSLCFCTFVVMVSGLPHLTRTSSEEMCSCHCCLLVIPNTVRTHLRWNESSLFKWPLNGTQHSLHTCSVDQPLGVDGQHMIAKNSLSQCTKSLGGIGYMRLSISASILPFSAMMEPRYWNSVTCSISPPSTLIGCTSHSSTS